MKKNKYSRLDTLVFISALTTTFIALIILVEYALEINNLSSLGKNFIPMAEETALLFLFSGITLAIIQWNTKSRKLQFIIKGCAIFIGTIALLGIIDFITYYRWNLSDLIGSSNTLKAGIAVGKMALLTALCFLFQSIALLMLLTKGKKYSFVFSSLILFTGYIIVVGYSYGVPLLYGGTNIPMAWPTAIAFIISSLGLLFAAGKDSPPISYFVGNSTRAKLMRYILPLMFAVLTLHDIIDAVINGNHNTTSALSNSVIDIVVVSLSGYIIFLISRYLASSIDESILMRKQAEEALRKSEEDLFITLHSIGDGVISTDKEGLIVRMNTVAEKLSGWRFEDAAGKPLSDVLNIINTDTRETVANPVKKVLECGQIVELANHTVLISKDGKEYQIADSAAPIKTLNGDISGVVLVFSDVTEKYAIQQKIKENEERYRSLIKNLKAGIVVHGADTSIIMNNPLAEELLGLSHNQMRGKVAIDPAWKFINEDYSTLPVEGYPVNRIIKLKSPIQNQILGINHPIKNYIVWVSVNGFPVLTNYGDISEIVISFIDITEQKNAEEALRKSEEKYRLQFQNMSSFNSIYEVVYDSEGKPYDFRFVMVNKAYENYVGKKAEDLIGKTLLEVYPETERFWIDKMVQVVLTEKPIYFENYSKVMNTYTDVELYIPQKGQLAIITSNINDRKIAEEKIREKDIQFRKLSSNVPDLIFQFTKKPDGTYCVPIASEGIKNIFGCSPEDVINDFTPIAKVIFPEDAEKVINQIEHSAKHLTYFTCEFRVQIPGKPIQWIYSRSTPEKLPDGSITWYGFNTNITERKLAEEKIKEAQILLKASIESPQDMIILSINKNYNYLYFNSAHSNSMQIAYAKDIKLGMNLLEQITNEDDRVKAKYNYDLAMSGLSHVTIEEYGEVEKHYYETRYNPIRNEKNEIIGATAFSSDITKRILTELELEQHRNHLEELVKERTEEWENANEELKVQMEKQKEYEMMLKHALEKEQELNEMKSRFISTTSHEFRTPLTAVLSSTEMLQRYNNKWSEEKKVEHFNRIANSVEYLTHLLDDILIISRADSGKISYNPENVDLYKFAEDCFNDTKLLTTDKHKLKYVYKTERKEFQLDPKLMKFILSNLLSNAAKYSPHGGNIQLKIATDQKLLCIEVIDEGMGIQPNDLPKVFDSFYRTKNVDGISGTGLGLAIVKRSVELHNGEITVASEIGKGTTFSVKIPLFTVKE